jgi:hypothetical protein
MHLVAEPQKVWEYKDDLETFKLLDADPLKLYKGKFLEYMKAKAKTLYAEYTVTHDHTVAIHLTNLKMQAIAEAWKAAAARIKENK